jgi:two-component system NtrC family sensor kinase
VRLESRLAEGLPCIEAAPDQLVQVLLNLLLNAKQVLKDRRDATIVASTSAVDGQVEIRIADNGPGIPEPIRNRIFDPFFTTRPPNEGTGLGLSIALDIVSRHGGTLELDDAATRGACFVVRLPCRGAQ